MGTRGDQIIGQAKLHVSMSLDGYSGVEPDQAWLRHASLVDMTCHEYRIASHTFQLDGLPAVSRRSKEASAVATKVHRVGGTPLSLADGSGKPVKLYGHRISRPWAACSVRAGGCGRTTSPA